MAAHDITHKQALEEVRRALQTGGGDWQQHLTWVVEYRDLKEPGAYQWLHKLKFNATPKAREAFETRAFKDAVIAWLPQARRWSTY